MGRGVEVDRVQQLKGQRIDLRDDGQSVERRGYRGVVDVELAFDLGDFVGFRSSGSHGAHRVPHAGEHLQ